MVDDIAGERAGDAAGDRADRAEHGAAGRAPATERRVLPSVGHSGKAEGVGEAPPPPRRDGDLGDGGAVMGMHHQRRGALTMAACLAGKRARQRNSSTSPGANCAASIVDQMRARGFAPSASLADASAQSGE